jgi:hypothetical protein
MKSKDPQAKAFRKRFALTRTARMKAASKRLPKVQITAATNLEGPFMTFPDNEDWTSFIRSDFKSRGIKCREVTKGWILKQRRAVSHHSASMIANRLFDEAESHFAKAQKLLKVQNPARPTIIVVLDMNKKLPARERIIDCMVPLKSGSLLFGQYVVQKWKDGTPMQAVPVILTNFQSVIDRPQNYHTTTHANLRAPYHIYEDREGIYSATLQMLDQMLEQNKSILGIDMKLIVTHGDDIDFDQMNDIVHCKYEELDAAIKSRIMNVPMIKLS